MDGTEKNAPGELCRVPFFPDGSRLFEEIDRLGISDEGVGCLLTGKANFDFYCALPSGGYERACVDQRGINIGAGYIAPEPAAQISSPYRPGYFARKELLMAALARVTDVVQQALTSGNIWARFGWKAVRLSKKRLLIGSICGSIPTFDRR